MSPLWLERALHVQQLQQSSVLVCLPSPHVNILNILLIWHSRSHCRCRLYRFCWYLYCEFHIVCHLLYNLILTIKTGFVHEVWLSSCGEIYHGYYGWVSTKSKDVEWMDLLDAFVFEGPVYVISDGLGGVNCRVWLTEKCIHDFDSYVPASMNHYLKWRSQINPIRRTSVKRILTWIDPPIDWKPAASCPDQLGNEEPSVNAQKQSPLRPGGPYVDSNYNIKIRLRASAASVIPELMI